MREWQPMQISDELRLVVADMFKAAHRKACYPDAYQFEAEIFAEGLLATILPTIQAEERAKAKAATAQFERDQDELLQVIRQKVKIAGAHQLWCARYGEKFGWNDSEIAKLEPFMLEYFKDLSENIVADARFLVELKRKRGVS